MSQRTQALRPVIALDQGKVAKARQLRRQGHLPERIAEALGAPLDEVEKALVQMRMPRPETTRGTLNVTLAAHRLVQSERRGDEPIWQTVDRMLDELLRLREEAASRGQGKGLARAHRAPRPDEQPSLLAGLDPAGG